MRSALQNCDRAGGETLETTGWRLRNYARVMGRKPPHRCFGTHLLVKGLEFEHALILDVADFVEPESLYVAMTRGSRSLKVFAQETIQQRAKPSYLP
jgi:DNA helicase-2/ATP-dependent DNA helicase PcrA